jgi:hypothetical protein
VVRNVQSQGTGCAGTLDRIEQAKTYKSEDDEEDIVTILVVVAELNIADLTESFYQLCARLVISGVHTNHRDWRFVRVKRHADRTYESRVFELVTAGYTEFTVSAVERFACLLEIFDVDPALELGAAVAKSRAAQTEKALALCKALPT